MLKALKDKLKFKQRNLEGWENNTNFWLSSELRQLTDTKDFLLKKLPALFNGISSDVPTVIDMGTGSGWALDLLQENNIECRFIGLDFNQLFIEHLRNKYKDFSNAEFLKIDLEETLPENLINAADIVFNFFNFFEIANLDRAFENAAKMLKPGGILVIMTIDSYYLMFALAKTMEELKEVLSKYEEEKSEGDVPYFFQKIDLGNRESKNHEYASVLYSFNDYYKQANLNKLTLFDYSEIVKTSKFIPKVYQYIVFQK